MISVPQAKEILIKEVQVLQPITLSIEQSLGLVTAKDIFATADFPPFDQSAMDGYAFRHEDWLNNQPLSVTQVIKAGDWQQAPMPSKQAVRIFTGAAMPSGLDTVVVQEKARVEDGKLILDDPKTAKGINIRPRGSEIEKGTLALPANSILNPGAIGLLAGIGVRQVLVYPFPKVRLLVTGSELVQPGEALGKGKVYESNSFALGAALHAVCVMDVVVDFVPDDKTTLENSIAEALQTGELLLLTGGVSVGDYDFVAEALFKRGVVKLFHKVRQKPGKPLFVGKADKCLVFGLPGNPASVLTCFYEYVLPCIERMRGLAQSAMQVKHLRLAHNYSKKTGMTNFLKGYYVGESVTVLEAQESYRMRSFANANCLICLDESGSVYEAGSIVEVHSLP